MSARRSRSPPSTSAARRRRILARHARCQLDTGLGRPAPRSLPGAWSRTQDQEGDKRTRLARRDEPYDAVVASLLPAPLRKRCDGVIPALRAVLTPGLAPLARRERPARLPVGRAAWPNRLHAAGSPPACQEDGHPRARRTTRVSPHAVEQRARMAALLASTSAPRCVQAVRPRRSSNWQSRRPPLRAAGKR